MTDRAKPDNSLTKSDLIEVLGRSQSHLERKDVEMAVKGLLEKMSAELASGDRIEIRGFGSFSLHLASMSLTSSPAKNSASELIRLITLHLIVSRQPATTITTNTTSSPQRHKRQPACL